MRVLVKDASDDTLTIIESSIIFCNKDLNPYLNLCESVIVYLLDAEDDYWISENMPINEYENTLAKGLVSGYIDFSKYRFALDDSDDDDDEEE